MTHDLPEIPDADWAFERYEAIRARLPALVMENPEPDTVADLSETFERFDAFILDGYGVLNVGGEAVPGAVERVAEMRAAGKPFVILTNAATDPLSAATEKYRKLGFDVTDDEIVASRALATDALSRSAPALWGVTAAGPASLEGLGVDTVELEDDDEAYRRAEAFLLLSASHWTDERQGRLEAALSARPRPVLVANPDLVAPRESGLTLEPGAFAHRLADVAPVTPEFFGKPFPNAFDAAMERFGPHAPPVERVAMVGDTLHTDILGGRAAGLGTVLITDHGLFAGRDVAPYIERSGIVPHVIAPTI